jgi:hypothetical protein
MSGFIENNPSAPYAFIQWKGTDVCMDFHCECGAHCHVDADFAYFVDCPHCGQRWQMPSYVYPRKADKSEENTPVVKAEPDEELAACGSHDPALGASRFRTDSWS